MIVRKILAFIDDDTTVILRNNLFQTIASGRWYNDQILDRSNDLVESFTWQDDNKVYIDLKEV